MAGAIFWIRQLFHRLRRPVLVLQDVPELKHSDLKLAAFHQYLEVAKEMKAFEETKFTAWVNKAQTIVSTTMKRSILKMVQSEPDKGVLTFPDSERIGKTAQSTQVPKKGKIKEVGSIASGNMGSIQKSEGILSKPSLLSRGDIREIKQEQKLLLPAVREKTSTVSSSLDKTAQPKQTWTDFMSGSLLIECKLRFEVNFNWDVFEIIQEAELMEQLGFSLSPAVKEVGIQKDRLREDVDILQRVVKKYNSMLDEMSKPDIQLLKKMLLDIEKHIQPGVMRINWDSLNIVDFGNSCEKLLKNLSSTIDQINHMKADLDNRIFSEMQRYNLFSLSAYPAEEEGSFLPCKTYFLEIHSRRTELVSSMRKLYESTGPLLKKLESLVLGTATGCCPAMQLFYESYERKIFGAFITCMVNNLDSFNKTLTDSKPIFQVDAVLIASEAVLRPSPGEIYTIIIQNVKNLLEELKRFPRWMHGTCLECWPQKKEGVDDYVMFSFFEDVLNIQVNKSVNWLVAFTVGLGY
ncbi:dynein axonemal heavy chain 10-like [Lasioglossum baleicum]|uniref:dynein axonemal heavy chain 10-like n=1 Tax=Lasioglossum baleicum TaxID=434251 RepID=UPI003FCD8455